MGSQRFSPPSLASCRALLRLRSVSKVASDDAGIAVCQVSIEMPQLTAQQYSECWKQRVAKEEAALSAVPGGGSSYMGRPHTGASADDDDVRSVCSHASARSAATSAYSEVSSRVSSSSSSARKLELLQKQLEYEREKRKTLETELKAKGLSAT